MPGFLSRARAAGSMLLGRKAVEFDRAFLEYFDLVRSWSGRIVTIEQALQVSTALACGRVIAEGLAMQPWKIMRKQGNSIQPALDHPLYDKLGRKPNAIQSAFEFRETMGMHLAFCGNSYAYVPRVSGHIDEFYLFEPGWVKTKYRWPEPPTYDVSTPNGTLTLSASEVWHVRGPSFCTYVGLEFAWLARQALGLSLSIEEGQSRMQGEGVQMPGMISIEGNLTDEQHKKLKKWLLEEHSGPKNAGRWGIVDRAAKFLPTTMSNIDAQTIEQRKFLVEEVCRFMRVLPIMVGFSDKTATYASSEQMFLAHLVYTLGPWDMRVESSADRWLLTDKEAAEGYYTNLDEKALLRMTAKDQMEVLARGVLSGIIVRNEAREKLDMNPLSGLDEPLAPANTFVGNPPAGDAPKPSSASNEAA